MAKNTGTPACSFPSAMALSELGMSSVPEHYILPPPQRPILYQEPRCPTRAPPVIDLSGLDDRLLRAQVIEELHWACKEFGVFQVINHGITMSLTNEALDVAEEFFNMPNETKMRLASTDVCEPVRYGTSLNQVTDKVRYWRDFIKHYSNPISKWIGMWPSDPPTYKKKMGDYAKAVHDFHAKLMGALFESLGLGSDYLQQDIDQGSQVLAVNCYPACPEPNLTLGLPPHSDYGMLTIILQNQLGLEIMDSDRKWQSVPVVKEALVVQVGDQLEVLSNGLFKSIIHRAIVNSEKMRLSIASLHSLAIDGKVTPAPELVDEQHPLSYKECSFGDFLKYLLGNDVVEGRYIDTLKWNPKVVN